MTTPKLSPEIEKRIEEAGERHVESKGYSYDNDFTLYLRACGLFEEGAHFGISEGIRLCLEELRCDNVKYICCAPVSVSEILEKSMLAKGLIK